MEEMRRRLLSSAVFAPDGEGATGGAEGGTTGDKGKETQGATGGAEKTGEKEENLPEWAKRRLDTEYGKRKELERRVQEAEAERDRIKAEKPKDGEKKETVLTEEEVDRRANAKAAQNEFNRRADAMFGEGEKTFEDFEKQMKVYLTFGGFGALEQEYGFLSDVMETDDPKKALYDLSKNPEQLQKILDTPSRARRLIELNKVANAKPKKQTQTPPPPDTTGGGGDANPEGLNDQLPTAEWMERRRKTVKDSGRRRIGG